MDADADGRLLLGSSQRIHVGQSGLHRNRSGHRLRAIVENSHAAVTDGFDEAAAVLFYHAANHAVAFMHEEKPCYIAVLFEVRRRAVQVREHDGHRPAKGLQVLQILGIAARHLQELCNDRVRLHAHR
jgi:hypothetical protein